MWSKASGSDTRVAPCDAIAAAACFTHKHKLFYQVSNGAFQRDGCLCGWRRRWNSTETGPAWPKGLGQRWPLTSLELTRTCDCSGTRRPALGCLKGGKWDKWRWSGGWGGFAFSLHVSQVSLDVGGCGCCSSPGTIYGREGGQQSLIMMASKTLTGSTSCNQTGLINPLKEFIEWCLTWRWT